MKSKSPQEVKLVLSDNEGVGRISVDLEAFFAFSFWMAEELQDLVEKWKHVAPPANRRSPRPARRPKPGMM
jgi:histidinol phosphatase-like enzyme